MTIDTVKLQDDGYKLNGNMSVPNDPGNRHYQEIQEWIAEGNVPEPEFTPEQLLVTAKANKLKQLETDYAEAAEADVLVQGSMYPADRDYQLIVLTLASRAGRGRLIPSSLRGVDGVPVTLTPTLLDSLEDAIFNQIATAVETLSIKTGLVATATTPEEVEAITFVG